MWRFLQPLCHTFPVRWALMTSFFQSLYWLILFDWLIDIGFQTLADLKLIAPLSRPPIHTELGLQSQPAVSEFSPLTSRPVFSIHRMQLRFRVQCGKQGEFLFKQRRTHLLRWKQAMGEGLTLLTQFWNRLAASPGLSSSLGAWLPWRGPCFLPERLWSNSAISKLTVVC